MYTPPDKFTFGNKTIFKQFITLTGKAKMPDKPWTEPLPVDYMMKCTLGIYMELEGIPEGCLVTGHLEAFQIGRHLTDPAGNKTGAHAQVFTRVLTSRPAMLDPAPVIECNATLAGAGRGPLGNWWDGRGKPIATVSGEDSGLQPGAMVYDRDIRAFSFLTWTPFTAIAIWFCPKSSQTDANPADVGTPKEDYIELPPNYYSQLHCIVERP